MSVIDDMLEEINQELIDMNVAEQQATASGLSLGDFNLQTATAKIRADRIAAQKLEEDVLSDPPSLAQKPIGEEPVRTLSDLKRGTAVINGQIAEKDLEIPENIFESEEYIEKTYPKGGVYRVSQAARDLARLYEDPSRIDPRTGKPSAPQSLYSVPEIYERQLTGADQYGEEFEFDAEMAKDFPELARYQKVLPFEKVRQVIDKTNIVDGKPTMYFQPVYDKEAVIRSAPKESEFAGLVNKTSKHTKALQEHFKRAGIKDWKKLIKDTDQFREIYDIKYD